MSKKKTPQEKNQAKIDLMKEVLETSDHDGIRLYSFDKLESLKKLEYDFEQEFFNYWAREIAFDIAYSIWRFEFNKKRNAKAADLAYNKACKKLNIKK